MLDVARQVDEEAQLIVRIEQPWGDYLSRGQHRLSPHQVVDALLRSGVGLSGVNLEIGVGYSSRGSAYRDLLECSRLIDAWTLLDVPIFVTVICPSSQDYDPRVPTEITVNSRLWDGPLDELHQASWIDRMLELLVAKPRVAGVFIPHFSDGSPHAFPNAGLLRSDETPKPVVNRIISQRLNHRRKN